MTVLGIETSSLIPNPVFLSYTIPTLIGSSGNLGTRERGNAQTCSFHAMTQVSSVLMIVLSDIPVLAAGWREAEKGFSGGERGTSSTPSAHSVQGYSGSV